MTTIYIYVCDNKLTIPNIIIKYVTHMYTVFYMYLHEYDGVVFTAFC